MLGRRQEINLQLNQLADFCILVVCLRLAHWMRGVLGPWLIPGIEGIPDFSEFFWMLAVVAPFTPLVLESRGFYSNILNKSPVQSLRQLAAAALRVGVMIGFCEIFLRWEVHSRAVLLLTGLLAGMALLAKEALMKRFLRQRLARGGVAGGERVLLAGPHEDTRRMLETMTDEHRAEMTVVGEFDVTAEPVSRLVALLHEHSVSRVVFAAQHVHFAKIEEAVQACETEGVEAWIGADFLQTAIARPSFDVLGGRLMLVFHSTPAVSWSLWMKEVLDRVGALLLIVLSAPVWLVAMAGLRLSSRGPIFFAQDRAGRNGRPFRMFKFRTMCVDAESRRPDLEQNNEMSGPVFKVTRDPRVFVLGSWLRKLSIDELPQLLNVLRGEMSLVGPRPLPLYEIEKIEKHAQRRRLSVKPGLTCLWQIMGRNRITNFEDWVALDLKYIDNWSIWLDLEILCKTPGAVLRGAGAH
jgi:exopolysaccharide biosynthesis polyprenyl glycosylphosphotransferase